MCANSAVIESIECYMEDIIECFEAFVKKTLLVVTIAAGALVAMAMYFLKNMQGRNRSITGVGAETQIEQIFGSEKSLQETSSTTSIKTDKGVIRKSSYSKLTSTAHTDEKSSAKKSRSCCSGKKLSKCPNSVTKVCEKASSSCSRQSSCESFHSRIAYRESAPNICSKRIGPTKSSKLSSALCSLLPMCPSNAPCKRTCKPPTKRASSPKPCAKSCTPISTCKSRPCPRTCGKLGRSTIPSMITCNTPKYKVISTCCSNSNIPCHIPKPCPSKLCTKVVEKKSCCSTCCDDELD